MAKRFFMHVSAALIGLAAFSTAASAQSDKLEQIARPKLFKDVLNCRTVTDPAERLACYDTKVAALDEAQSKEEIIVTDREALKEAKRGLFGLNLPKLRIFGGEGETQLEELTTTIKLARKDNFGKWTLILEDGAKWVQIDSSLLKHDPKPGMVVKIRNAALGSFFVNVEKQKAIKMKRSN